MRFAVFGDVHSNKYALESVLNDISSRNVDFIVSTGDLVGYLPFPNEVIEMVRNCKVLVVQGNHDKNIADSDALDEDTINKMTEDQLQRSASSAYTNWIITEENRKYLRNLPNCLRIECNGLKVLVVHGSPSSIDEYLYEDKEKLSEVAKVFSEDILICGHTHIPYHLNTCNKHFINAGSAGKPKHGDSSVAYVIVDVEDGKVESRIIKVVYDVDSMVKAIEDNRMFSEKLIPMLREGY